MESSNKIVESTILFKLSMGLPAQTKQAKSDSIAEYTGEGEGNLRPDEKSNKLVKNLFTNCAELEAIKKLNGNLSNKIRAIAVPSQNMFKDGLYLISLANVERVNTYLESHAVRHAELKQAFIGRYFDLVAEQRGMLTVLFNEDDYDTAETVYNKITVSSNWIRMSFPDTELQGVSMAIYEKESREFKEKIDRTADEVVANLRLGTKAILDKMRYCLTVPKGEKPKAFRASMIANSMEFINFFRSNNFLKDSDLEEQVNRMNALLEGKDADEFTRELKKNTTLREQTLAVVEDIRGSVVEMVARPVRSMVLRPKEKAGE